MGGILRPSKHSTMMNVTEYNQSLENDEIAARNLMNIRRNERVKDDQANAFNSQMAAYKNQMNAYSERLARGQAVTEERARLISQSGNLLTDFEQQERKRLRKAKTGTDQVDEYDTAITGKMRQEAIDLLEQPEAYWTTKRNAAMGEIGGVGGSCGASGGSCGSSGGGTCPITGQPLAPGQTVSPEG